MRIALTHPYSWPEVRRGAERITHELSGALAGRGHEVTVLTAGSVGGTERRADGVEIVRMQRRHDDPAAHEKELGRWLVPLLKDGGYDAVHSFGLRDAVAAIRSQRRGGHRTVFTHLGVPVRWWCESQPDKRAHRRVVRSIDVYGCMSQFALAALRDDYGREGALTPGGVNLEQFRPAAAREAVPTILFSAALEETRKGGAPLVAALGLLTERVPNVRLWLSGPGDPGPLLAGADPSVRDRIEVLPLGDPEGQAERYGRAWVTTLPSEWDSFGMVLVESLACGTPIVASTHAAVPELVEPGVTGALCEPNDPPSLAAALETALDLVGRAETAERCRASAAPYDWSTGLAPRFEKLYAGES